MTKLAGGKTMEYKVTEGMEAPEISLMGTDGKIHNLKEYRGGMTVLFFYPKDNTPGCTSEAAGFQSVLEEIQKTGAKIIGVSRDSIKSHEKFRDKLNLTYPLLSDENEEAVNAYGVIKDKNMFGKKVRGIERTTFLIDKDGKVIKIWRKPKTEAHAEEVLEYIKSL